MTTTINKKDVEVHAAPDQGFAVEYERLAAKVGYTCPQLAREVARHKLTCFLLDEHIRVYDYAQVHKFMDKQVTELDAYSQMALGGHALRNRSDVESGLSVFTVGHHEWTWTALGRYHKPIPLPVLMTIEKIIDGIGAESVEFFITDIVSVPKPDPFLAVRAKGDTEYFVIERWDEPNFREKGE